MSYTFTEHIGNGNQTTFTFSFSGSDKGYLKATDIVVELMEGKTWKVVTNWQLSGTHQITFSTPPDDKVRIRIRRVVDKTNTYANFDRNVVLDMKSLNNSFIHLLSINQEILDGFYPEGYFIKQNVDWGGNRITNLGDALEAGDAVNKGQLDALDKKHTDWNKQQDVVIEGIKSGMTSDVAHRTIPWIYTAAGGETKIVAPYVFEDALVFINGVLQYQLAGAIQIKDSIVSLAEPLLGGDEVLMLIGSRIAAEEKGLAEVIIPVSEGQTKVDIGTAFLRISVFLDGLRQPSKVYSIQNNAIVFDEPLPECDLSAIMITA